MGSFSILVGDPHRSIPTRDMKNNVMASVHVVKALLEAGRSLSINLIFLFEGCEEIGSLSLRPFVEERSI